MLFRSGLVYGESLGEAADKVCDYYGENNLISVKLKPTKYTEIYVKEGEQVNQEDLLISFEIAE